MQSHFIYLVSGIVDEPGIDIEWEVAAYMDREEAERHAKKAEARAEEWRARITDWEAGLICGCRLVSNELDQGMKIRPNWPTNYIVRPVPLRSEAPEEPYYERITPTRRPGGTAR